MNKDTAILVAFTIAFTTVAVLIVRALLLRHRAPYAESKFNFDDLLLDDVTHKASLPKCGYWFFAGVMALCMVYSFARAMDPVLLVGLYLIFAACGIIPLVMVLFKVKVQLPTLPSVPMPSVTSNEPMTVTATATVTPAQPQPPPPDPNK